MISVLLSACSQAPIPPSPVGSVEEPVGLTAVRATTGRYSMQYLGTHMDVVPADGGAEDLVLWSNVADLYDPGFFDERPTPGEVVVLKHDRTVRLHDGSNEQYGARVMPPLDLDGDGEWDLVVRSTNYTDFLMGPFEQNREQGHSARVENHDLRNIESPLIHRSVFLPATLLGGPVGDVLAGPFPVSRLTPLDWETSVEALDWERSFHSWTELEGGQLVVTQFDMPSQTEVLTLFDGLASGVQSPSLSLPDGTSQVGGITLDVQGEEHIVLKGNDQFLALAVTDLELGAPQYDVLIERERVRYGTFGDFDGDGETDFVASVYGLREESPVAIWRGPLFEADPFREADLVLGPVDGNLAAFGRLLQAVDLDGDGRDELAVMAADGPGTVHVYDDPLRDWHDLNPGHR